jgi:hypothetical protein
MPFLLLPYLESSSGEITGTPYTIRTRQVEV